MRKFCQACGGIGDAAAFHPPLADVAQQGADAWAGRHAHCHDMAPFQWEYRALHAGQRYLGADLAPALLQRDPAREAERLAELSLREFEVFRLLALGHSLSDCARALKLSPKTVSNHQTVIKEKLGVTTSAALAHMAIRHRLIESALL